MQDDDHYSSLQFRYALVRQCHRRNRNASNWNGLYLEHASIFWCQVQGLGFRVHVTELLSRPKTWRFVLCGGSACLATWYFGCVYTDAQLRYFISSSIGINAGATWHWSTSCSCSDFGMSQISWNSLMLDRIWMRTVLRLCTLFCVLNSLYPLALLDCRSMYLFYGVYYLSPHRVAFMRLSTVYSPPESQPAIHE